MRGEGLKLAHRKEKHCSTAYNLIGLSSHRSSITITSTNNDKVAKWPMNNAISAVVEEAGLLKVEGGVLEGAEEDVSAVL
jgi:hypothetical protein